MDAGIGEAMLLSAAMGGGSAAITGGDPLKGALLGALTGGVGAGIGGMMSGAMPGVAEAAGAAGGAGGAGGAGSSALPSLLPSAVPSAGAGFIPNAANAGITAIPEGMSFAQAGQAANAATNAATANSAVNSAMNQALPLTGNLGIPANNIADLSSGVSSAVPSAAPSSFQQAMNDPLKYMGDHKMMMAGAALTGATGARYNPNIPADTYDNPLKRFHYSPSTYRPSFVYAEGGIASLGGNSMVVGGQPSLDNNSSNMASGGISNLGSYSDGGRMLKGPGDGMSDSIPASIAGKRPARLAQGEFVVPADVVSHLGNGSTDAGANQLYHMMNKVRQARTGRKSQGREINPGRYMPA
jgi:hypothetical protein